MLPPSQAFPRLSGSTEQARSERTRDKWEAREGDDGNERRARAGTDPSHHSFPTPPKIARDLERGRYQCKFSVNKCPPFSLLLAATPIAFSSY